MPRVIFSLPLALFLAALFELSVGAQTPPSLNPPAASDEFSVIWQQLLQPVFTADKTARVDSVRIERDRVRLELVSGNIQFAKPVNGVFFAGEFRGQGRLRLTPPNAMEAQQLQLFTGQTALDLEFTDAVFTFSDDLQEEVGRQVKWVGAAGEGFSEMYNTRQMEREDVGAELMPRLFQSIFSGERKRTALFVADLKTAAFGWVHVRLDALNPEEITVGRWEKARNSRVTGFDTWLSFPAGNRSSDEAFRDPLVREDFLIRSYRIEAGVTQSEELQATARVTLEQRTEGERVLVFELDSNLRVQAVKNSRGDDLKFFQPRDPRDRDQSFGDYVVVVLPEASSAGSMQTLEFRYGGKRVIRREGKGIYFCQSYGWYPSRPTSFATRADFELEFRYPKKYQLVATGNKTSERAEGETAISTWKSEIPLAVAGFAFGEFKVLTEKSGAVDIEVYASKEPDDFMQSLKNYVENPVPGNPDVRVFGATLGTLVPATMIKTMSQEMGNTVRLFEKYFGPYPYKKLSVTSIPYWYGQGWPGLIYLSVLSFLDSTQRNTLGIEQHTELSDFFRAHESSHQWWGHRVGWKSYHDQWLSEGFAQFSGNLYVHMRQDMKAYLVRLRKDKELIRIKDREGHVYESVGPIWMGLRLRSSVSPFAYSNLVYNKGGLVLHMLRMMLFDPGNQQNPEQRFMSMLQDFCRTYDNRPASTEDFKAIVEKHMLPAMNVEGNGKMDWFFRQYVYGTGIPEYQLQVSSQRLADGKVKVSGTITQSGVPAGWKDILPIYMHPQGKPMLLGWTRVTQRENKLEFTLPFDPGKLQLNVYEDILADIK